MLDFGFCWLRRTSTIQWRMHGSHEAHRKTQYSRAFVHACYIFMSLHTDQLTAVVVGSNVVHTAAVPEEKTVYSGH